MGSLFIGVRVSEKPEFFCVFWHFIGHRLTEISPRGCHRNQVPNRICHVYCPEKKVRRILTSTQSYHNCCEPNRSVEMEQSVRGTESSRQTLLYGGVDLSSANTSAAFLLVCAHYFLSCDTHQANGEQHNRQRDSDAGT